jgi:asparagine synthase (glutamine-hydrolysing)
VRFPDFWQKRRSRSPLQVSPAWYLVWGYPDNLGEGVTWKDEGFAIFHAQPAISPQQRFVVVGDIWLSNQAELRRQLGIDPVRAIDECDTQIVAHLWERCGVESLKLLQGMFSVAVWDREQQELCLGRDRVGANTLYYTTTGTTRWVAPRLRTLAPHRSDELDLVALRDYLCCAFVPGERTLWQDVRELRPGTILHLSTELYYNTNCEVYWEPQEQIRDADKPLEWHGKKVRSLLEQVILEYLPAGEAVGAYLSGGLDSSCITALAARFHDAPVHTYSIHFGSECPNELEFSSLVAQHCQTQHHILEITPAQMWEQLPITMAQLDDPIGDPLTVPNYLLGQQAREIVKVILNGEGGDPCFGGPKNQPMLLKQLYGSVIESFSQNIALEAEASINESDILISYLNSFQKCALDLPQLLQVDIWNQVKEEQSVFTADLHSDATYLNKLMVLNIKYKGADHILTKVNNLTRAARLEGRSPLFDQRFVDNAMQIPPEYKLAGAEEKAVLKQAVADLLPIEIIRRPKSGMMVPVQLWFRKLWQRQARALLLDRKAAIASYLNQQLIKQWLDYRGDTWNRYGVKLWLLVSLEMWLQENKK